MKPNQDPQPQSAPHISHLEKRPNSGWYQDMSGFWKNYSMFGTKDYIIVWDSGDEVRIDDIDQD